MWGTKTLERARRRLGLPAGRRAEPARVPPPDAAPGAPSGAIEVVITRAEKDALAAALASLEGGDPPRLDSPAHVEAALADAIDRAGGRGAPLVVRSPAALYTPEYWHIRIDGADAVTRTALGTLIAGRRID